MKKRFQTLFGIIIILNIISLNAIIEPIYEVYMTRNIGERENRCSNVPNKFRDTPFSLFIADSTPKTAKILVSNEYLTHSVNTRYTFPRELIYLDNFNWSSCDYPNNTTHLAISIFEPISIDIICTEIIGDILQYDYDGYVYRSISNSLEEHVNNKDKSYLIVLKSAYD